MANLEELCNGDGSGDITVRVNGEQVGALESISVRGPNEPVTPIYSFSGINDTNLYIGGEARGSFELAPNNPPMIGRPLQLDLNDSLPVNFEVLSPEKAATNNIINRVLEFYGWLKEEQGDLEEECGADLSGLIDKMEEIFPEVSGEESPPITSPLPLDFEGDMEYFRRSMFRSLGIDGDMLNQESDADFRRRLIGTIGGPPSGGGLEDANYETVDDYYGNDNDDGFNFGG